jgi:hypothetical protein
MWYFWIDQHRKGKTSAPDDRRAKVHIYTGEDLGGGAVLLKTVCGRKFFAKEINIISNRQIIFLLSRDRGRLCKMCSPAVLAEKVADILGGDVK